MELFTTDEEFEDEDPEDRQARLEREAIKKAGKIKIGKLTFHDYREDGGEVDLVANITINGVSGDLLFTALENSCLVQIADLNEMTDEQHDSAIDLAEAAGAEVDAGCLSVYYLDRLFDLTHVYESLNDEILSYLVDNTEEEEEEEEES